MDQTIFKRGVIESIKKKILCDFEYEVHKGHTAQKNNVKL